MNFRIQAGYPRYSGELDEEVTSLSDAIEAIFPLWTEDAYMVWDYIPIALGYKYDISLMIDDILTMFNKLRKNHFREMTIHWASNTFANKWIMKWQEDVLVINSEWGCVTGGTEQLLTRTGSISGSKQKFASEWKRVLYNVILGLGESGYTKDNLPGMARLVTEYNAIESEGILYTD